MAKVNFPPFPLTGGCQCGAVRYELRAAPVVFYLCHCTECQKQSSSAFGESVRVRAEDITVEGERQVWNRDGSKGRMGCEFCPECGTRLFHSRPGSLNIKGGTFDDRSWMHPAGHIWTGSKQPFVAIADDEIAYERQPADYDALIAKWREMTAAT